MVASPIELGDKVWEDGYDPEFNARSVEVSRQLPAAYRAVAGRRCVQYIAASDYAQPSDTDREHMNAEGHRRFAQGIGNKIEQMIWHREQRLEHKRLELGEWRSVS